MTLEEAELVLLTVEVALRLLATVALYLAARSLLEMHGGKILEALIGHLIEEPDTNSVDRSDAP